MKLSISDYVLDASHVAGLYYLYQKLTASAFREQIFYITSGNALGLIKYGAHLPWDDDLDLGFKTDHNMKSYLSFLEWALTMGYVVNFFLRDSNNVKSDSNEWYQEKKLYSLVLEHCTAQVQSTVCNSMTPSELEDVIATRPGDFFFANITFNEKVWQNLLEKVGGKSYFWEGKYLVTPWIDFFPYYQDENGRLQSRFQPYPKSQPSLSATWKKNSVYSLVIYTPLDLIPQTTKFYHGTLDFNCLYKKETLYCHLLDNDILHLEYNEEELDEVQQLVDKYSSKVQQILTIYQTETKS